MNCSYNYVYKLRRHIMSLIIGHKKESQLLSIVVIDIFIIGLFKEILFSDDINILTFIRESLTYNLTHFSFSGVLGVLGMILLVMMIVFMPIGFLIINWQQLKSCFTKK